MKNVTLTIASVALLAQLTSTLALAAPIEHSRIARGWETSSSRVNRALGKSLLAATLLGGAGKATAADATTNPNLQPYAQGETYIDAHFPDAWEVTGGIKLQNGSVRSIIGGRIDLVSTTNRPSLLKDYDNRLLNLTRLELSLDHRTGEITAEQIAASVYSFLYHDAGIRLNGGNFTYSTLSNGMILMKVGLVEAVIDAGTKINDGPLSLTIRLRGNLSPVGISQPGASGYSDRARFVMPGADGDIAAGFILGDREKSGIRVEGTAKGEVYAGEATRARGGLDFGQGGYGARIQAWTHVGKEGKTILSLTVDGGKEGSSLTQYGTDPLNDTSSYGNATFTVGR